MPTLIPGPARILAAGTQPKIIDSLVLLGTLRVETRDGGLDVHPGQAVVTRAGEWIRYSTPGPDGADYVAVWLPALSPDTVHRDG